MKKEYLGVTTSQFNSLVNKIKNKFSIEIEGYSGKKEYMGACLEYSYDKGKKVFYVDTSIGFPANMRYSEKDILSQLEKELIKCGWEKS